MQYQSQLIVTLECANAMAQLQSYKKIHDHQYIQVHDYFVCYLLLQHRAIVVKHIIGS